MVQPIDNSMMRPTYNAVNINIKKPEINREENTTHFVDDNGIYNAVNIGIDNPIVNTGTKKVYEYPEAKEPVTYAYANLEPIDIPKSYAVAYHTTNVILPNMENEIELANEEDTDVENEELDNTEITNNVDNTEEETVRVDIPEANYTTTEAEKGLANIEDNTFTNALNFRGKEIKRPEIIPAEEIKPEVDIPLTLKNLKSSNYDTQAGQMEEIARLSLNNTKDVIPYIVRDVFTSLIDITEKDTKNLPAPTAEQIQARKKIITNFLVVENAKQNKIETKLPYQISAKEIELANNLSPMEEAERNKEYALYTISILSKIYADEIEKQTGNIVPLTDLPGSAAIVDALRYNPNAGVKIAAIDSLKHIQRPEYNQELKVLFTIAKADPNPQVAMIAEKALAGIDTQK